MMLEVEEKLFDEFKRADSICRDMFWSQSGIGQYITEMERNDFYGRYVVSSWDRDYRMLKRVRWLRNQIAHDSSATDCSEEDAEWLEEFHRRLLTQNDPLAVLEKAKQERQSSQARRVSKPKIDSEQSESIDISFDLSEKANKAYQEQLLSSKPQHENMPYINTELNEKRTTHLPRRKDYTTKIAIIVLIGFVLLIGLAAAAVLFFYHLTMK